MGYLKQKYTKAYFTDYVGGVQEFLLGDIRPQDKDILKKLNFTNKSVLDLGFGRGEAIKYVVEHGAKKVVGVDFSKSACEIAKKHLSHHAIKADLFCDDIIKFLKKNKNKYKFDVVLLLDVVEHIPRQELANIFRELPKLLGHKAIIVINTPIFKVDNDGYKDGINPIDYEDTDEYEATKGMHINRYTKFSLIQFMKDNGFSSLSTHYFVTNLSLSSLSHFRFPQMFFPEHSEYAYSRKYDTEPNVTPAKKVYRFFKWKLKAVLVRLKIIKLQ